jgi:glycosyltransferase involved in cell wall biosynthesis
MISITIPTYEMNGIGKLFFENSLTYIAKQTFKDFEVVVSDHSESNEILGICLKFNELDINYVKNKNNKGSSSANLNNAIKHSKYNIIKFLMQDEYLYDENTLFDIKKAFDDENINWVVTGCLYGNNPENQIGKMLPVYNDNIIEGNNTIGSPSVVSVRKTNDLELFNQDLIWLMDCDYYKRLYDKWGEPTIISDYKIFVNQHENQVTNILDNNIKQMETQFVINKYKK